MKIGIDCRELRAGYLNGIGRFVRNLLHALGVMSDPPQLYLYGNQWTSFETPAETRAHIRQAREAATWWWDRITLPKLARRDRLDVFLSPYFKAPGVRSCPVVITIHDLLFLRMPSDVSGRSAVYCRAFRSLAASFARRSAAILTVSEHSRKDIIELLDVPAAKVHVVGNAVGEAYHPIHDADRIHRVKRTYHIGRDYILYIGNFGPHKNVDSLINAYARLEPGIRDRFALVLAGPDDKWAGNIRQVIHRMGLSHNVTLTGYVQEHDLPVLYGGASAFVTLSRWEGFGLPVLEAMACGTPVVCSNTASLPEVAADAALLVDPSDADACANGIARILTDEPLRQQLREKGLERAAYFSPQRVARLVLDALKTVANPK